MFRRAQHGFTLVELVLTVGLIALMGSLAAMTFPTILANARLSQAVTQLSGGIREAQIRSLRERRSWRVVLDADGRGFALEYAASNAPDHSTCDAMAWTQARHEALPYSIQVTQQARSCVSFSPTGGAAWLSSSADSTPDPSNAVWAKARLTDGFQLKSSALPAAITADPGVVGWRNTNPVITLSFQELRYLSSICLGTFDYPSTNVRYPTNVKVEGTRDLLGAGAWTTIYDKPGPPSTGPSGRFRTCVHVPINEAHAALRITLVRNTAVANAWVILDEIDGTNLFLRVQGPYRTKQLMINSVTGRVTVESVAP